MVEQHKELIRDFIAQHVPDTEVDDDEDLFAGGLVNSLFAVQLVVWVERTFDLRVEGADLDFAHFASVDAIAGFVAGKLAPAGGGAWTSN
ncbi:MULTISPECIES: phosphopantetheine-binding protein [unclassified Streptomyces]|uniref:phosphopantetheine-binding protein n=1 Tax=unclassified Streptomyces TaxID=2593676 RepID=UPI0033AD8E7E